MRFRPCPKVKISTFLVSPPRRKAYFYHFFGFNRGWQMIFGVFCISSADDDHFSVFSIFRRPTTSVFRRFWLSERWEMQPAAFFDFPKFGKVDFRCFSVFPMLERPFSSVFRSSQVWERWFSTFSCLPNLGKAFSADFWFSLVWEIRFPCFLFVRGFRKAFPYEIIFSS